MKKIFWIFFLTGLLVSPAHSQINKYGVPFIRNFDPQEMHGTENNWSAVLDHRGILYVGNNDAGILEFDGVNWRAIPLSNRSGVRSLHCADDGTIYVGGEGDFGYLAPDRSGIMRFVTLLPKLDTLAGQVTKINDILENDDKITFCEKTIWHEYIPTTGDLKSYDLVESGFRNGNRGFLANGHYYLGEYLAGLIEFKKGSFEVAAGGEAFNRKNILGLIPYSKSKVLINTHANGAYLYDYENGQVFKNALTPEVNDFMKKNRFYCDNILPNKNIAFGTLDGGIMITGFSGIPIEIWNRQTGLRDQTITQIYHDPAQLETGQLWTVLYNGLASVEYFSPFRLIDDKFGIQGTINDIVEFDNALYVATSSGVFYYTTNEEGWAHFNKIEEIGFQAWSFLKFTPPGSASEVLWVGTEGGIYNINGKSQVSSVEKQIKGLVPSDRKFYTYKLFSDPEHSDKVFFGSQGSVEGIFYSKGTWNWFGDPLSDVNDDVRSLTVDRSGNLWAATSNRGIVRIDLRDTSRIKVKKFTPDEGLPSLNTNFVYLINGKLLAATMKGLYAYNETTEKFGPATLFGMNDKNSKSGISVIKVARNGNYWLSRSNEEGKYWIELKKKQEDGTFETYDTPFKRLPNKSADAIFIPEEGPVWIGLSDKLYTYNAKYQKNYYPVFHTLIREIRIGEDSVIFGGVFSEISDSGRLSVMNEQPENQKPILKYRFNNLTFTWACPYFEDTKGLQYSFRIKGFNDAWSKWSNRTEFTYTNLPHGNLTFEAKAKNVYDVESTVAEYNFTILPPWYQTFWAYILYVFAAFGMIWVIVKLYTRRLKNEKIRLEGIVAQRTSEVVRQKDELEDSITYASRIQRAILPNEKVLNENLPHHFILFKPRDIVSGDFYWMATKHNKIIVAAADCTGHGVPGAFMSLLGMSYLNEIVNKSDVVKSDQILGLLRKEIMTSLKQTGKEGEAKDGMDIALCIIDKEKKKLQFSGAYNPLFMVRPLTKEEKEKINNGIDPNFPTRSLHNQSHVLEQVMANKMPIGISAKELTSFTYNEITFEKDHSFYIFSDGYVDQFGGPDGKKFMVRAFKKMILNIQDKSMTRQGEILDERFREWKGELPQVDDILVIGFKMD